MMEEKYFSDGSIIEQSSAMIQDGDKITNGISLVVRTEPGIHAVEILLEYDELKKALADLQADRDAGVVEYT